MQRAPDLVQEIHRIASRRGWSQAELARSLGIHRSILVHARGGRRAFTGPVLARISRTFGDVPEMKELIWAYLRYDLPVDAEERGCLKVAIPPAEDLPEPIIAALRRFVRTFPLHLLSGRGLVISGRSAKTLSAASRFLDEGLRAAGVRVHRRPASHPVGPSEREVIAHARLLILERADGGKETAGRLVAAQLGEDHPVVVTTACGLDAVFDPALARELRSRADELSIDTVAVPGHA